MSIIARWREVPYLGLTPGRLYRFLCTQLKELTTDSSDLPWRW